MNIRILKCITIVIFLFANVYDEESIEMWREPMPIVQAGKLGSVIQDNGQLQHAIKASNGWYLFSEKGAGSKALVLIGTPLEVLKFFADNKDSGIKVRMNDLNKIYMGISSYMPKKRFKGLFPVQDFMLNIVKQATCDYAGMGLDAGIITTLYNTTTTLEGYISIIKSLFKHEEVLESTEAKGIGVKGSKKKSDNKNLLYVKFGYLPEDGMQEIAERNVGFDEIIDQFRRSMPPSSSSIACCKKH